MFAVVISSRNNANRNKSTTTTITTAAAAVAVVTTASQTYSVNQTKWSNCGKICLSTGCSENTRKNHIYGGAHITVKTEIFIRSIFATYVWCIHSVTIDFGLASLVIYKTGIAQFINFVRCERLSFCKMHLN